MHPEAWLPAQSRTAWRAMVHEVCPFLREGCEATLLSGHGKGCPLSRALDLFAETLPFEGMRVALGIHGEHGFAILRGMDNDECMTVAMELGLIRQGAWTMDWLTTAERVLSRVEAASWSSMEGWEGLASQREVRRWGAEPHATPYRIEPRMVPLLLEVERMGWQPRFSCEGHPVRGNPDGAYISMRVPVGMAADAEVSLAKAGFRVEFFEEDEVWSNLAGYSPRFSTREERDEFLRSAWNSLREARQAKHLHHMVRLLCRRTHKRWISAPWKLARDAGETDAEWVARSEAGAASHGLSWNGELRRLHPAWGLERADHAGNGWVGVRRAS